MHIDKTSAWTSPWPRTRAGTESLSARKALAMASVAGACMALVVAASLLPFGAGATPVAEPAYHRSIADEAESPPAQPAPTPNAQAGESLSAQGDDHDDGSPLSAADRADALAVAAAGRRLAATLAEIELRMAEAGVTLDAPGAELGSKRALEALQAPVDDGASGLKGVTIGDVPGERGRSSPTDTLELLKQIVNVRGASPGADAAPVTTDPGQRDTRRGATDQVGLGFVRDELERSFITLIEPRIQADGSIVFDFSGLGEFRADYDAATETVSLSRGNAQVQVALSRDKGEQRQPSAFGVVSSGEGAQRDLLQDSNIARLLDRLLDSPWTWVGVSVISLAAVAAIRDERLARRRRRTQSAAANTVARRPIGASTTSDGLTATFDHTLERTFDETLDEAVGTDTRMGAAGTHTSVGETTRSGAASGRRKRRKSNRPHAEAAHEKGVRALIVRIVRSLGLLPGAERGQRNASRSRRRSSSSSRSRRHSRTSGS